MQISKNEMIPYDNLNEAGRAQQMQLFDDMLPYYSRIAVYDPDKEFINANKVQCLRLALAGKHVMLSHKEVTPEQAIFSDELFSTFIAEAWSSCMSDDDKRFLNDHLQEAAECFRMGFMMADLPEVS